MYKTIKYLPSELNLYMYKLCQYSARIYRLLSYSGYLQKKKSPGKIFPLFLVQNESNYIIRFAF